MRIIWSASSWWLPSQDEIKKAVGVSLSTGGEHIGTSSTGKVMLRPSTLWVFKGKWGALSRAQITCLRNVGLNQHVLPL